MKSKISFFNKTIFKKNVTLYWPIWVLYTLFLVFVQPVMFWSNCYYSKFYDMYTYQDKLEDLIEVIYMDVHIYFIAFMALASGMALFHYLYNQKSANMIHAFPVDRIQLFGTNVLSGIAFLAVPQTISCVLLAIVALCNGVMEVYYIAYWWLLALGTDVVAFSVVTFCAMFTGHLLALPVYTGILNYFSYLVYYLIYVTVSVFGFGINDLGRETERVVAFFSPTECFIQNVGLYEKWDSVTKEWDGVSVYGVEVLAIYLAAALVLYAAAFITYKKRHIEQAGEFITVGWVKPIFRFGVALAGGFLGGILMREFLRGIGIGCNMALFVILLLIFGAVCFFIADMLLHKSFRVFKKKNWMHCGICMAAIVVTFFGILGIGRQYENYQPELAEIESAYVDWGYEIELEAEEAEVILALHKEILANRELCMKEMEKSGYRDYEYVRIGYYLKNGDYTRRSYELPNGYEQIDSILTQIAEMETDVDNYLNYVFVENYEDIEVFYGGYFEAQFVEDSFTDSDGDMVYNYNTVQFSEEQAKEIYEAIIADVNAGTLMKYNIYSEWIREGQKAEAWKYSEAYINIVFQNPKQEQNTQVMTEKYSYTYPSGTTVTEYVDDTKQYSAHLNIGPDCEHIVNKLIEFGFIESVDEVWWGSLEED